MAAENISHPYSLSLESYLFKFLSTSASLSCLLSNHLKKLTDSASNSILIITEILSQSWRFFHFAITTITEYCALYVLTPFIFISVTLWRRERYYLYFAKKENVRPNNLLKFIQLINSLRFRMTSSSQFVWDFPKFSTKSIVSQEISILGHTGMVGHPTQPWTLYICSLDIVS